eukprot:7836364-Pyramimonas_sp.AAC.1
MEVDQELRYAFHLTVIMFYRAAIEAQSGIKLADFNPEDVKLFVQRSKEAGNAAFQRKHYAQAVELYCQVSGYKGAWTIVEMHECEDDWTSAVFSAIAGDTRDKALFSNRSAAYLAMGRYDDGLADAVKCVELDATWSK